MPTPIGTNIHHAKPHADTDTDVAGTAASGKQNAIDKKIDKHTVDHVEHHHAPPPPPAPPPPKATQETTQAQQGAGYAPDPLEALKSDPHYQEVCRDLDLFDQKFEFNGVKYSLEDLINIVDQDNVSSGDGIVWRKDLEHTNYWHKNSGDLKDFASKTLLASGLNGRLVQLTGGFNDGVINVASLRQKIADLKAEKGRLESEAKGPQAPAPSAPGATQPGTATQSGAGTQPGTSTQSGSQPNPTTTTTSGATGELSKDEITALMDQQTPRPEMSHGGGLEGAQDNMTKTLGWCEQEIDRLTELMGKTSDPAVQKQLEMKINRLTRQLQSVTAMINQISTLISNLSKMWSDIAMNAIRNIR